jgi:hypothetical protein
VKQLLGKVRVAVVFVGKIYCRVNRQYALATITGMIEPDRCSMSSSEGKARHSEVAGSGLRLQPFDNVNFVGLRS